MPPKPRKSGPIQLKMSKSLKNQLRSVERMLRKPVRQHDHAAALTRYADRQRMNGNAQDLPPSMRKGAEDKRAKLQAAVRTLTFVTPPHIAPQRCAAHARGRRSVRSRQQSVSGPSRSSTSG